MVFEDYAKYYDLLYSDKNYKAECGYVSSLIQLYAPDALKILEFGSGSGIHGNLLAQTGFVVHGIERSQTMIDLQKVIVILQLPALRQRVHLTVSMGTALQLN